MIQLLKTILSGIMLFGIVTCGESFEKEALSLPDELDTQSAPYTFSQQEKEKGWQLLFNGTSREGWHGYNMEGFPDWGKVDEGYISLQNHGTKVWNRSIKIKEL